MSEAQRKLSSMMMGREGKEPTVSASIVVLRDQEGGVDATKDVCMLHAESEDRTRRTSLGGSRNQQFVDAVHAGRIAHATSRIAHATSIRIAHATSSSKARHPGAVLIRPDDDHDEGLGFRV